MQDQASIIEQQDSYSGNDQGADLNLLVLILGPINQACRPYADDKSEELICQYDPIDVICAIGP